METCYVGSTGMSAADFLHGPIAFIEEDTPTVACVPDGPTRAFMAGLIQRLNKQGVDVLSFTNRRDVDHDTATDIYCPTTVREALTPIPFGTLGQLFACHLALIKRLNPDAPRRLKKITRTL